VQRLDELVSGQVLAVALSAQLRIVLCDLAEPAREAPAAHGRRAER
jgi:hypothetical protein